MATAIKPLTDWSAAQASPWNTVNANSDALNLRASGSVKDKDLTSPPGSPSDKDAYIVGASATGAWAGEDGNIAVYDSTAAGWDFYAPYEGLIVWVDDEDMRYRYSGSSWAASLKSTNVSYTNLFSDAANGQQAYGLLPTEGGDGVTSIYRISNTTSQNPRTKTISSISTDTITITTADADDIFTETYMTGVSYLRIWNTTKSPNESAWVKAQPAANQLQVTDSADISGWSATDTIQAGDPGSGDGFDGRVIALDISPMQIALFGAAFRQRGMLLKCTLLTGTAGDETRVTPDGSAGSFSVAAVLDANDGTTFIPTTALSPISSSNLLCVRETFASTAGVRGITSMALLA